MNNCKGEKRDRVIVKPQEESKEVTLPRYRVILHGLMT